MDLALNNLQGLICDKTQQTKLNHHSKVKHRILDPKNIKIA